MNRYDFIIEQVRAAGELLMRLREEKFDTMQKDSDPRDVVTSVDLAVNDFIIGKIREAFPEDIIYSEESNGVITDVPNLWTIDPIDGSSNFSRGIPHFAVCVAFLQDGVPEAGAVYNPVTGEIFSFRRGGGAFLNGKSIHVSGETDLKNSFVLLHAGRDAQLREWGGRAYRQLLEHAKKTSNLAGSALDACFVAAGRVEANIYGRLTTMDIACAIGILLEAGGRVVNDKGESIAFSTEPQKVIMSNNAQIEAAILKLLFR
ncbi:MAG: inositol monophosphatase family protein [Candidatus Paceibacterota bacterium]|jgi:myo-inositol-1(or 4)-monophosphatase